MRRLTTTGLLLLSLLWAEFALAGNFQEAMDAYRAGSYKEAITVFTVLAGRGDTNAQFQMGLMLHQGRGAPQNYKEALKWYRKAADKGHAGAQNNLGIMYRNGDGVRENKQLAYMWFSLAASQFNERATVNRDDLAYDMSTDQVLEAQQLTSEYMNKLWQVKAKVPVKVKKQSPGFLVQLGLFGDKKNIQRISQQLAKAGMPLLKERVDAKGNTYYRLRVGPFSSENEAEQIASRMDKLFHIKTAVVPENN